MKQTLWTRNFTIITAGTFISIIGNVLSHFALSLVIFDETQSAFLSGSFAAISMIPNLIIPLIISPFMDSHARKPFVYGLDYAMGAMCIAIGLITLQTGFNFVLYLIASFALSSLGSAYQCAYQSLYPDLIPEGFKQKGYAVSSMLYPTVTIIFTPLSAVLYNTLGIELLLIFQGVGLLVAATFESFIKIDESYLKKEKKSAFSIKEYINDLKEALKYLKNEKGLSSLYAYMSITNGGSQGGSIAQVAFFQSSPIFTTAMFSFFLAANTLGRFIGGFLQYIRKFPKEKKFTIANVVYKMTNTFEMIVLYLPYPLMLIVQFCIGIMGVTSMTLRESAVQQYLPPNKRARIFSFFNILFSFTTMIFQLLAGILSEFIGYRITFTLFAIIGLVSSFFLIDKNSKIIKPIFNVDC